MKFELKIIGDTSNERDRRILRETALLLNSGVSASAVSVAQVDDNDDEEETAAPATIQPGEVDANGLPWDERIHSGGKTKTKAGVWRTAKGVGDDVINAVTAELRARGFVSPTASPTVPVPTVPAAAPVQTPISTTIPVPTPAAAPVPVAEGAPVAAAMPTPVAAPVPVAEGAPVAAAVPTPVAAPVPVAAAVPTPVAAPAPAAPAPAAMDFATLMGIISASAQTGKIDGAYLAAICAEFGLGDNLATLAAMPDKIPSVHMTLLMDGKL